MSEDNDSLKATIVHLKEVIASLREEIQRLKGREKPHHATDDIWGASLS